MYWVISCVDMIWKLTVFADLFTVHEAVHLHESPEHWDGKLALEAVDAAPLDELLSDWLAIILPVTKVAPPATVTMPEPLSLATAVEFLEFDTTTLPVTTSVTASCCTFVYTWVCMIMSPVALLTCGTITRSKATSRSTPLSLHQLIVMLIL